MAHASGSKDRFAAIFCGYRREDVLGSRQCVSWLKDFLPTIRLIGVSTSGQETFADDDALFDAVVVSDNQRMEFGAYQDGIDHLRSHHGVEHLKGIFFLNDTIGGKNYDRSIVQAYAAYALLSKNPDMVYLGKCDRHGREDFNVGGLRVQRWVSTHLFYASIPFLRRINFNIAQDLLGEPDNRREPATASLDLRDRFFRSIDPRLSAKLEDWLFGGRWHGSEPLSADNYVRFRKKLVSILNELYLSALARDADALVCVDAFMDFIKKMEQVSQDAAPAGPPGPV